MKTDPLQILIGDSRRTLATLPEKSVHTVVTSPPYYGLRDYDHPGQIGLEETLGEFLEATVQVFREVWRVLRDDGTIWVNMGDSYASDGGSGGQGGEQPAQGPGERREPTRGDPQAGRGLQAQGHDGRPVAAGIRATG